MGRVLGQALTPLFAVGILVAGVAHEALAGGLQAVATFTVVRNARVSTAPVGQNPNYVDARVGGAIPNGHGVRTGRRAFAEIEFKDLSLIRVNELTDFTVQDSASLRRIDLAAGSVWLRVTKGSRTSVRTPVATATVRGTELTFGSNGDLLVWDGTVDLEAGGETIQVNTGEAAAIGPDGRPYKKELKLPTDPNRQSAGDPNFWWKYGPRGGGGAGIPEPENNEKSRSALGFILAAVPLLYLPNDGRRPGQPVPEPTSAAIMGLGLIALGAMRRASRRK